jgi:large subunit ribosomal protein L18
MMNKFQSRVRRGLKAKAVIRQSKSNRPRLVVFRSAVHIYSQIVVRVEGGDKVLVSSSTIDKEIRRTLTGNKCDQAREVGRVLAERAIKAQISCVAFDRAGFRYHGRVKALAEGAREGGINF